MYEEADDQCSELYSNDIKIGIERGTHRGWVEKENVGSVVGPSRTVFGALFLHEEHLKTTRRFFKSLYSSLVLEFSSHDSSRRSSARIFSFLFNYSLSLFRIEFIYTATNSNNNNFRPISFSFSRFMRCIRFEKLQKQSCAMPEKLLQMISYKWCVCTFMYIYMCVCMYATKKKKMDGRSVIFLFFFFFFWWWINRKIVVSVVVLAST